jgi:DNA-binding CsgD family transcriptional regulator
MSLTLSSQDLAKLQAALAALLSPLDSPDAADWAVRVTRPLKALVGAPRAALLLPTGTGNPFHTEDYPAAFFEEYLREWASKEDILHEVAQMEREVWSKELLLRTTPHGRPYLRSEVYQEFYVPQRLLDVVSINLNLRGWPYSAASLLLHHEVDGAPAFGKRAVQILRLLVPAFKAGVRSYIQLAEVRARLRTICDSLDQGIVFAELTGRVLHQNAALARLLAGEPRRELVVSEITQLVRALAARVRRPQKSGLSPASPVAAELRTGAASYRLWGTFTGPGLLGADPTVIVGVERVRPEALSDADLQTRYRLTARECEVARLLTQGKTDREIAAQLGISVHTAERHTEHVLLKLGARRRAEVATRLQVA